MAPTAEKCNSLKVESLSPGEEIAISGIAGAFPDSDNMKLLEENLFNKVDLISEDNRRWEKGHPGIPHRSGKINNINKFDASFFDVNYEHAHVIDPASRMLLEKTYECIVDAGYNPEELRGGRVGVFIGTCFCESEKTWFFDNWSASNHVIDGCSRAMFANRISNWLGVSGPSYMVDTACSSSMYAMELAVKAIRDGLCDSAIVGGANLCLHPGVTLQFARLGVLSEDGACKTFDDNANGYVRSEVVSSCFLQKTKDARRVYAKIIHAKTNCDGYKQQGITYPSGEMQKKLLEQFYDECGVDPASLEYVEAHGTGTRVGDPEELQAIDDIFCKGRSDQLLIGGIKSNLGHAEPGSGLCSIAKLVIAYNTGYIPPNLHYSTPRQGVALLTEARAKVVTEKTPWNRGMCAASSFGFGGANAHVLLKKADRGKINGGRPSDNLPRLVCLSGRTESAVTRIITDLESRPVDVEQVRLWHAVHAKDIKRHNYRGYVLLGSSPTNSVTLAKDIQYHPHSRKEISFVYSSFELNWIDLIEKFVHIPQFAAAIDKCCRALESYDVNIAEMLFNNNHIDIHELPLLSLIGNTMVHIGLTDIMESLGINADHFIGHGFGELMCAYADRCWSAEQTILAAHTIGLKLRETLQDKCVFLVHSNYKQIRALCPPTIRMGCETNSDWCIIGGVTADIEDVVAAFTSKGISSIKLHVSNYAYYLLDSEIVWPELLPSDVRPSRWVKNNVVQPSNIDQKGIIVNMMSERLSWLDTCNIPKHIQNTHVNIHKNDQNVLQSLLVSVGKVFEAGHNPQLANIYPHVQFPVAQGTPMLSPLIEWDHSENWFVASYSCLEGIKIPERKVRFELELESNQFVAGHCIDGRVIFPATGYLTLVWETLALMTGRIYTNVSVVFEDVCFCRATNVPKESYLDFTITIHNTTGRFEITENNVLVVTGRIFEKSNVGKDYRFIPPSSHELSKTKSGTKIMSSKDFYKELNLRGYQYKDMFRGVLACSADGSRAHVNWANNWTTFLDTVLQVAIVSLDTRSLYVPTRIERIAIDVDLHAKVVAEQNFASCRFYQAADIIRAGGAEIYGLHVTTISKKPPLGIPVYEKNEFVPNVHTQPMSIESSIRVNLQIIFEIIQTYKFKTIELIDEEYKTNSKTPCIEVVGNVLGDLPMVQAELHVFTHKELSLKLPSNIAVSVKKMTGERNVILCIAANLLKRTDVLEICESTLKDNGFILSREDTKPNIEDNLNYNIITTYFTGTEYLVLIRKKNTSVNNRKKYIKIISSDETFSWIEKVKEALKEEEKVVLYNENEPVNGFLGLVNCLRREPGGEAVSGVLIADPQAPPFDPNVQFYKEQLNKNLAVSVYKNGQWGTYRHLLLDNLEKIDVSHAYVNTATIGDLSSLSWWEGTHANTDILDEKDKTLVHVYCSALNFRDVMTAMGRVTLDAVARGRLAQDCVQGMEVAGKLTNGTRVMGICEKGISTLVSAKDLFFNIPDEWSFEEAATVPVAYGTVYVALVMIGNIRRGESILIHAGSGGVGQAAINVALHHGLEVFTTVGTPAKREFIKRLYPQIKDSHIGNSRDTSFEEMIRRETGGRGVDVVLNSLADDKLVASANSLCRGGRFLEIGKFDITNNTQLKLCFMEKEISFHGVMLDYISDEQSVKLRKCLANLLVNGMKSGAVRPITYCTFEKEEMQPAYRYMAAGKHVGKVIIKIRDEEPCDKNQRPTKVTIPAIPRYSCNKEEVYVLVGGLGGFGLELADWLVLRGARKLVLTSRRGVSNGYQYLRLKTWESYGTRIEISTHDVTNEIGCKEMLEMASSMGPVKAIFNLAVILRDALFENQDVDSFKTSCGPKAVATKNLDKWSRLLCPELRDFVIFSSVSCGRGNAGQTNYGFSNSIMERICELRKEAGLPALAIQWGAIGDVGLVADMQEENLQMEIGGTLQQRIVSCLQSMDRFLKQDAPIVSSIVVAEKKILGTDAQDVVNAIAHIIGIADLKTISHVSPLYELGLDSIMAVEIKQTLEREFEIFLTADEIRNLTFARLFELSKSSEDEQAQTNSETDKNVYTAMLDVIVRNLSDEEVTKEPFICVEPSDKLKSDNVLFMLPGVESCAANLEPLCRKLNMSSYVLQLGLDTEETELEQVVQKIYMIINSRLSPGAPFYLLGYSFGSIPMLALAAKLESEGHKGIVFCLDGSLDFTYTLSKTISTATDDFTMQTNLMLSMVSKILTDGAKLAEIQHKINTLETIQERIRLATSIAESKFSEEYITNMTICISNRLKIVFSAKENNSLEKIVSPIVLLRSKHLAVASIAEDYGLSKLTKSSVDVHCLDADHTHIMEHDDCSRIINDILISSEKTLEQKEREKKQRIGSH